jgi:hypothetical protein
MGSPAELFEDTFKLKDPAPFIDDFKFEVRESLLLYSNNNTNFPVTL